jgi:uncharacterized protein YukE
MAQNADISVSFEAKESSKSKFIRERDGIVASLERLQREVNNLQSWWKGESGIAFMETFTKVKNEIKTGIEGCVAEYCALMDATVDAQMEADRQLAAKVRQF